jgi:hypothetical protein
MNVLSSRSAADVTSEPYPHLVVERAIDDELCRSLTRAFPPIDVFTNGRRVGDNVKFNYPAVRALADPRVSARWKEFLRDHVTQEFYRDIVRVFGPALRREYPDLESRLGPLDALRTGLLRRDGFERCEVLLDGLLGLHTPVAGPPRQERRPHVKGRDRLLVGFLYLRADDDAADGGAFEMFRVGERTPRYARWRQTDQRDLHLARTVPYRSNTLVVTLNTRRSIQALSARGPGTRPLMYFHFLARVRHKLFDLDYTSVGRAHEVLHDALERFALR